MEVLIEDRSLLKEIQASEGEKFPEVEENGSK